MRKLVLAIVLVVAEGVGFKMLEIFAFDALLAPPWIFFVFAGMLLTLVGLYWPDVKDYYDLDAREDRRSQKAARDNRQAQTRSVRRMLPESLVRRDVDSGTVTAYIGAKPSKWRYVRDGVQWFGNVQLVPYRLIVWLHRQPRCSGSAMWLYRNARLIPFCVGDPMIDRLNAKLSWTIRFTNQPDDPDENA